MTMGTGVVLFVIGAILAFAVDIQNSFISLSTAGTILMIAGAVVFVIGLVLAVRGRRTTATTTTSAPNGVVGTTRESVRTSEPNDL